MSGPGQFLLVLWDGAGAVIVEARLAARLIDRGHRVTVLGPPSIARHFSGMAGCEFTPDGATAPYDAITDYPPDELLWLRDNVWLGSLTAQGHQVAETARRVAPDVVVCDSLLFGAMAGAEATTLPTAALNTGLLRSPGRRQLLPANHPARLFWESGLGALNNARQTLGLPPVDSVFDQIDAMDRLLVLTVREFDDDDIDPPGNARYVGPPLERAAGPRLPTAFDSAPLVLVSFSTSNMAQGAAFQRTVDALGRLPVRGLVTVGPAVSLDSLELPSNVSAAGYVPHTEILPHAAVVITHAGHGTVMAALAHGVPLLCMPMGRDQGGVAARVVATGTGLAIDVESPADAIAAAVQRILADPGYARAAAAMMEGIQAVARADLAITELEALAARE